MTKSVKAFKKGNIDAALSMRRQQLLQAFFAIPVRSADAEAFKKEHALPPLHLLGVDARSVSGTIDRAVIVFEVRFRVSGPIEWLEYEPNLATGIDLQLEDDCIVYQGHLVLEHLLHTAPNAISATKRTVGEIVSSVSQSLSGHNEQIAEDVNLWFGLRRGADDLLHRCANA